MSFATWNWLKVYARWRESILRARAPREPIDWRPPTPIITLTPEAKEGLEKIKNKGILVLVVLGLLLFGDSK